MLTARGDDMERIVGLGIGADDYLPKPFNPRGVGCRLRAIMRRIHTVEMVRMLRATRYRSVIWNCPARLVPPNSAGRT
jgi:two-component system OmpR family response regulator